MKASLATELLNDRNAEVLRYLAPLSCHGDNTEALHSCLSRYPDVHWFCPDTANYRYILWYTGNTVFAYGEGMRDVGLRIAGEDTARAEISAREYRQFDGSYWFSLPYDCAQLEDLVRLAYRYAKT